MSAQNQTAENLGIERNLVRVKLGDGSIQEVFQIRSYEEVWGDIKPIATRWESWDGVEINPSDIVGMAPPGGGGTVVQQAPIQIWKGPDGTYYYSQVDQDGNLHFHNLDNTDYTGDINVLVPAPIVGNADNDFEIVSEHWCLDGQTTVFRLAFYVSPTAVPIVLWQSVSGDVIDTPSGTLTAGACQIQQGGGVGDAIARVWEVNQEPSIWYRPLNRVTGVDSNGAVQVRYFEDNGQEYQPTSPITEELPAPVHYQGTYRVTQESPWDIASYLGEKVIGVSVQMEIPRSGGSITLTDAAELPITFNRNHQQSINVTSHGGEVSGPLKLTAEFPANAIVVVEVLRLPQTAPPVAVAQFVQPVLELV